MSTVIKRQTICVGLISLYASMGCANKDSVYERAPAMVSISDAPPVPNISAPVDYVAWINVYLRHGRDLRGLQTFRGFWRRYAEDAGMPDPPQVIKASLRNLALGLARAEADNPEVKRYIDQVEPYLQRFKGAAKQSDYVLQLRPDPTSHLWLELPYTTSAVYAAEIMLGQVWLEEPGQSKHMCRTCRILAKNTQHLADSGSIILFRCALRIRWLMYQAIAVALSNKVLKADDLLTVFRTLTSVVPAEKSLQRAIIVEWALAFNYLQGLYPGGHVDKKLALEIGGVDLTSLRAAEVPFSKLVEHLDKYFAQLFTLTNPPICMAQVRDAQELEAETRTGALAQYPLRGILLPSYLPVLIEANEVEVALHTTLTLLLIHDYHAKTGMWPMELSEAYALKDTSVPCASQWVYRVTSGCFFLGFRSNSIEFDNRYSLLSPTWGKQVWRQPQGNLVIFWPLKEVYPCKKPREIHGRR